MPGHTSEPPTRRIAHLRDALPFWLSLLLFPLVVLGAAYGGWAVLLPPLYAWALITLLDLITGLNQQNADTGTPDASLFWYRLITLIWFPLQALTIYGMIWWVTHTSHLSALEIIGLFYGVGVVSGTIGIVYAHELMHQNADTGPAISSSRNHRREKYLHDKACQHSSWHRISAPHAGQ